MTGHEAHIPSREEVIGIITRPIPKRLATASLLLAVVGFAIFIVGVVTGNARAWQAFHVNWLFFTTFSSAAIAVSAAQRITTARWSRPTIRILEGFVAWLPIAFVLLVGGGIVGRILIVEDPSPHSLALLVLPLAVHKPFHGREISLHRRRRP